MKRICFVLLSLSLGLAGCPDEDNPEPADTGADIATDTEPDGMDADVATDTEPDDVDVEPDTPSGYELTIENVSDETTYPTAFSPGLFALHTEDQPIYSVGSSDLQGGLESLAEDGRPRGLDNTLNALSTIDQTITFEGERGPLRPGESVTMMIGEEELSASETPRLSMATMFTDSNDYIIGLPDDGYPLFSDGEFNGGDLTDDLLVTDVGSERDQYPYYGPQQAPRQVGNGIGSEEGQVSEFTDTTHALPQAYALADINVSEQNGEFTFTIENIGHTDGGIVTPLSPPVYAVHGGGAKLFTQGEPAGQPLERLAEDGQTTELVDALSGSGSVKTAAAADDPIAPGGTYEFTVAPDDSNKRLSLASMVVRTNDAFIAFPSSGLTLLNDDGSPRSTDALEDEIRRRLGVWDAGTELNEAIGVGINQPLFSDEVGDGVPDSEVDGVQPYDAQGQNALANASSLMDISVSQQDATTWEVTVTNETAGQGSEFVFSPVLHVAHEAGNPLFEERNPPTSQLEALAETGSTQPFIDSRADAAATDNPLQPGDSVTFTVSPTADRTQVTLMAMVIPSNDAFIAANPAGVSFLDAQGNPDDEEDIETGFRNTLQVWDAGSEQNEVGGAGPGQPNPFLPDNGQSASDGQDEGDGTLQRVQSPLMPAVEDIINVSIEER